MSKVSLTSTDQFNSAKFRPHGRVEYEDQGRVLFGTAVGPFNVELMSALLEMAKVTFPTMAAKGPWANIALFRNSALCSTEVLEGVTDALKQMVQLRVAPTVTAFVLTADVEGALFMGPLYAKAFQDAGLRYEYFACIEAAYEWVESVLGPVGS